MIEPPALSRSAADRASLRRTDDAWLADAWPSAAVVVLHPDMTTDISGEADLPRLALVRGSQLGEAAERFFLGEDESRVFFAVVAGPATPRGDRTAGLREVGALLGDRDAGLLVTAVALANWHSTHTHCPRCGAPTTVAGGGWLRVCPIDGSEHYPRVDPAVIMLVHDGGDRCLLGRQASWPPGRFSTLAGFVEPGESAEHAVAREVAEETGVVVTDVRYQASQPWPFPSSLMLGFTARAASAQEPVLLDGELEEARWFTRAELAAKGGPRWPPPVSIANRLITAWVE
ncbi:MAG: NAD(+) diphosphatase [Actinomycetota bacterium]|nr:NAD(+) diphosphatase [Actinomycetota bacterium]